MEAAADEILFGVAFPGGFEDVGGAVHTGTEAALGFPVLEVAGTLEGIGLAGRAAEAGNSLQGNSLHAEGPTQTAPCLSH